MERNWLIRTSQDQILGPVAKAKVIEFLDKGALGLNDEVCSGNGYWFYIKEKDLVDKYLYGDIPQSFNPISEAKTVLAHHHRNPDMTASLSNFSTDQTQVIKLQTLKSDVALPKQDDLDFPDITVVKTKPIGGEASGEYKIPDNEDLEFPDVELIKESVSLDPVIPAEKKVQVVEEHIEFKVNLKKDVGPSPVITAPEDIIYPADDDLAFPEMAPKNEPKTISEPSSPKLEVHQSKNEKIQIKHEVKIEERHDEKKLLHERKVKTSIHSKDATDPKSDKKESVRTMPEEFKKRNDNYLLYILIMLIIIILSLFFYYYRTILNKPLPV